MNKTNIPDSSTIDGCEFISEHNHGNDYFNNRAMHHFLNDPKAKFILTTYGDVLNANHMASTILYGGMLKRLPCGKLSYGSAEINMKVDKILAKIRQKRATHQRLLKRQMDEDWAVLEFSVGEFNKNKEVLLTVSQRNFCSDVALEALSQAFGFTITESNVVRQMSLAHCPKEIATNMDISTNTVRAHLRSIYAKTGMRGYNCTLRLIQQLIA